MADGFYSDAPENLRDVIAQLARFYSWSKHEVEDLTIEEIYEWSASANTMLKKASNGR